MVIGLIALGFGIYFVVQGMTADYFVDESEGIATDEQKERWKATPLLRTIFVALGLAICLWSVIHIARSFHTNVNS